MEYRGKFGTLKIEEETDYYKALNLGGELTEKSVTWLLKWKTQRWLSPKSEGAKEVLARLDEINKFRKGELTEFEKPFFPNGGGVYDVFIRHIARPTEYPIYDRHVLNAYYRLEKGLPDGTPITVAREKYDEYRDFFFRVYEAVFGTAERKSDLETVKKMKMLDNALVAYNKAHEKK